MTLKKISILCSRIFARHDLWIFVLGVLDLAGLFRRMDEFSIKRLSYAMLMSRTNALTQRMYLLLVQRKLGIYGEGNRWLVSLAKRLGRVGVEFAEGVPRQV